MLIFLQRYFLFLHSNFCFVKIAINDYVVDAESQFLVIIENIILKYFCIVKVKCRNNGF